jgi:hypothetical protein
VEERAGRARPGAAGGPERDGRPGRAPHSPEARAGSPDSAAPPGLRRRRRRMHRPRQGRIMRPRSWPGRSGPPARLGWVRPGQAEGGGRGSAAGVQHTARRAGRRDPGSEPRELRAPRYALPAAPLLAPQSAAVPKPGPVWSERLKDCQFLEKKQLFGARYFAKIKSSTRTAVRKRKDGGYGLPQGPNCAFTVK